MAKDKKNGPKGGKPPLTAKEIRAIVKRIRTVNDNQAMKENVASFEKKFRERRAKFQAGYARDVALALQGICEAREELTRHILMAIGFLEEDMPRTELQEAPQRSETELEIYLKDAFDAYYNDDLQGRLQMIIDYLDKAAHIKMQLKGDN